MKLRNLALAFALTILSGQSFAEVDAMKQITAISSFGVHLGQPIKELSVINMSSEYVFIQPKEPLPDFFDTYKVIATPDNKVYKFIATGDIVSGKFSCIEAAAFLDGVFRKTYDYTIIKPLDSKNGEYVYMNDIIIASIMCLGNQLSYSYSYQKDLNKFPVPLNKFQDIKIKL